jgi:cytochrome c-type biogenesis protein CcmH
MSKRCFAIMILLLLCVLMTVAAISAVMWPLVRGSGRKAAGSDLVVYRDQLEEIERDRAAGLIGDQEAGAARVEVSRRLIGAADAQAQVAAAVPKMAAIWHRRAVAIIALVLLPLGAGGLYLAVGSPSLPGQPLWARGADSQSIERLVAQVEEHLAGNPDDARGWEVIAPVYLRLGRFEDAVKARRNALRAGGETAERQADLGEALVANANGIVTADAKAAFERATALDAQDVKSRYFLGLAAQQDGRETDAAKIWQSLLASAPPDAPWADFVRSELAKLGPGPTAEQVTAANALPENDQMAMVRGRVEQLSDRLHHQDGSDLKGWLQLMSSYMVLGDREKARAATGDARRALASDPEKLRQIDLMAKQLGIGG